jgi:hypothetical protein
MTSKKRTTKKSTQRSASEVTPDDTARRLAELLACERLPGALRDVLANEMLSFVERCGGFLAPDVLPYIYPALCIQAGDDPLRRVVESLAKPERLPKGEPDDAAHLSFPTHGGLLSRHTVEDDSLRYLGIFKGDRLDLELAKDVMTTERPIESGDMVLLGDRGEWHVGELRVEGDRVLLVSTYPAKIFRAKDVVLYGRVTRVSRAIRRRGE